MALPLQLNLLVVQFHLQQINNAYKEFPMASFLKEIVRTEPHTLQEIREALDEAEKDHKQLVPLLKEHHDYLQESIAVLLDKDSTDFQKQEHLERFFRLLEMHGKAEQEVLYTHLKANEEKDARLEGYAGQDEHDLAFQLEVELTDMGYKTEWNEQISAKAKVIAGLVKNHIKEEESMMFPIAETNMTEEELEDMRDAYIQKCISYLINDRAESIFAGNWKMGQHEDTSARH